MPCIFLGLLTYRFLEQGIPSRPSGDGLDGHSMWPSMRSVPNEFLESYLPLRVDKYEGSGFLHNNDSR